MVDTGDLKSLGGNLVRVQVPPRALFFNEVGNDRILPEQHLLPA